MSREHSGLAWGPFFEKSFRIEKDLFSEMDLSQNFRNVNSPEAKNPKGVSKHRIALQIDRIYGH